MYLATKWFPEGVPARILEGPIGIQALDGLPVPRVKRILWSISCQWTCLRGIHSQQEKAAVVAAATVAPAPTAPGCSVLVAAVGVVAAAALLPPTP